LKDADDPLAAAQGSVPVLGYAVLGYPGRH